MQGFKYAGAVVDWYDDNGATLKSFFPTVEALPEVIKTASINSKETVPNEDFALIMVDQGHVFRKFACSDAGTTAMSVLYFMEHGNKLPEEAQKIASLNLVEACQKFRLKAPAELEKSASTVSQRVVDITGKKAPQKVKVAQSDRDEDYAVVLPDGTRRYPIHNWDLLKKAEAYFSENKIRIQPEIRRQYATKLAAKAEELGYMLADDIRALGSPTYADQNTLQDAIDMRKVACNPKDGSREFLDELFDKHASLNPEVYAECLKRFDVMNGLDRGWDHVIPDPWGSTFGKQAAEVIWEDGADRLTADALQNLAENRLGIVSKVFTFTLAEEFRKDPQGIFDSLPAPQKKIMARMAMDAESDGSSERGTNVPMGKEASGPVELMDKDAGIFPVTRKMIQGAYSLAKSPAAAMSGRVTGPTAQGLHAAAKGLTQLPKPGVVKPRISGSDLMKQIQQKKFTAPAF